MVADEKESVAHAAAFMLQRSVASAQRSRNPRRNDVGGHVALCPEETGEAALHKRVNKDVNGRAVYLANHI